MTRLKILLIALGLLALPNIVFAHAEATGLSAELQTNALNYILIAGTIVGSLIAFSIFYKNKTEGMKIALFIAIVVSVGFATIYSAASTVYLNLLSESKGPVHWHADFEIWNCGEKLDLVNPTGMLNRVGSPTFHEHGDDRIHVEGVVTDKEEVSLHRFFEVVGDHLQDGLFVVPTNHGNVEMKDGEMCKGEEGRLQVFVYKVQNPDDAKRWVFAQEKLDDFANYILSPHSSVPPGDCIIVEFDREKDKTEHICETYRIAIEKGELSGS